jgi:M6 family metalloprotease-like protein
VPDTTGGISMHLMKSTARVVAASALLVLTAGSALGVVPPRRGGPLPEQMIEARVRAKDAFRLKRAWIGRKERQLASGIPYRVTLPALEGGDAELYRALSGIVRVPVLLGLYNDAIEEPVAAATLRRIFFDGPWPTGTISDYYSEVSRGLLDIEGTVYDWTVLDSNEVHYTAALGGISLSYSRTGELIQELVEAQDPAVDWGIYDNDGPDGIPNSGDDDGFVDVLVLVHPTVGAECTSQYVHMWSHSGTYSMWSSSGGEPYTTNDPAAAGGMIRIDDYIIGPALSCDEGPIEIGVFCHEFGHAFGLYDLYDWTGYSSGIGYWGLMGAGNWNTPSSPAHLSAWSKEQLGWIVPVEIGWEAQSLTLDPVETSGDAVKLVLPTKRFRRRRYLPIGGGMGLVCGYTEQEADARNWDGGAGYGNEWNESMFREFHSDGTAPATLGFDLTYYLEENYDFGYLLLECEGAVDTVRVYNGGSSLPQTIDLETHLPAGPCDFTLRFLFRSDLNFSDEDGLFDTIEGYAFTIDNISLVGGGIDYSCDFEADAGGWREDSPPAEYFLVENRQRTGFDLNLPAEGLLVWHAENSIVYSYWGNTGGYSHDRARGLVLEEADGLYNLINSQYTEGNFGDAGDPFPGSTLNRTFDSGSDPSSRSNGGGLTPASVTGINLGALTASAVFRAGMNMPEIYSVDPDTIDKETQSLVELDISGSAFLYGAGCRLALGPDTLEAERVDWLGEERLIATFNTVDLYQGRWDLLVVSGDGQEAVAGDAVQVLSVYESAAAIEERDNILLEWKLRDTAGVRGCLVFRAAEGEPFVQLGDTLRYESGLYGYRDYEALPETGYSYMIATYISGRDEETIRLIGPYSIPDLPFIADQNFPNPFSDGTIIGFFNPSARIVSIDIYDVAGRRVESFGSSEYPRGTQRFGWAPPSDLASGVYFCVFRTERTTKAVKMILVR